SSWSSSCSVLFVRSKKLHGSHPVQAVNGKQTKWLRWPYTIPANQHVDSGAHWQIAIIADCTFKSVSVFSAVLVAVTDISSHPALYLYNNLSGFNGTHDTLEHTRAYMEATQDTHTHAGRPEVAVNLFSAFSHPGPSFLKDPPG